LIQMEAMARGIIEHAIDDELTDRKLELSYKTFKKFEDIGVIKSAKSAMFGKIYSEVFSYFVNYKMHSEEPIKLDEMEEFENIIERRIFEIHSRILLLSAK